MQFLRGRDFNQLSWPPTALFSMLKDYDFQLNKKIWPNKQESAFHPKVQTLTSDQRKKKKNLNQKVTIHKTQQIKKKNA